ncbi:hypothetical protein SLT36_18140 [Aminobacter sp. BA135]|uniref:hypothetical protein n=1 Tax=Aminobacter sp. BA135 TaxID=537596 RepID=UPI003D79DCC8
MFDITINWGHVGLCLGDGRVIHAWVRIDDIHAVEALEPAEGWTQPRYVAWASVDRILQGHQAGKSGIRGHGPMAADAFFDARGFFPRPAGTQVPAG